MAPAPCMAARAEAEAAHRWARYAEDLHPEDLNPEDMEPDEDEMADLGGDPDLEEDEFDDPQVRATRLAAEPAFC